jgi:hypothetical protein
MTEESLWAGGMDDLDAKPARRTARAAVGGRHIGCPLWWFKLVFPIVRGKNELAVALFLYRLRSIHRSRTIAVTNAHLMAELSIDRFAKYRAIQRLADAGILTVKRDGKRALRVTFQRRRRS